MSGKRNVSVCRGHELANALHIRTDVYVFIFSVKNACFSYREFSLERDLVGVPHTWYLLGQFFITRLKLVWRDLDMMAMNN